MTGWVYNKQEEVSKILNYNIIDNQLNQRKSNTSIIGAGTCS